MRRRGIIHGQLSRVLAELRHTDVIVVADSGLPVPPGGPEVVDLAVVYGAPSFETVVRAVLDEIVVEHGVVATEIAESNVACHALLRELLTPAPRSVPHEEFKRLVAGARCVVRTGEATPYANVLLSCGVPF